MTHLIIGSIIIEAAIKRCAVPSEDLTAVVQSKGGTAQRLIAESI